MTAQAHEIVTDPFLTSVLSAADLARQQCVALLDLLDQHPQLPNTPPSREIELELSKQQKLLYSYLAQVRGLNRSAILGVRQTKQATAEARQEIDTLHLQLQNLYYEQRHLRGEIGACEAYEHKYQQLPLIPVEEFLEKFPEHMGDDENALMIARINHEHAERQALEESRQGLLKKKQGLIAKNKKQRDDLAKLDKDLEKFIEAANPIMKTFEKEY
ncbi:hypothetical protein H2201_000979 [Coniosporium apollinis]|uniref:THO complex subunit 5 n=1 Tax=Coniosporium apollinis TaxID=61459 RepID=A0ABQ9P2F0_9PEZI|nr:hypothetical protein H2201_000979 [Coniosporium apollinis]